MSGDVGFDRAFVKDTAYGDDANLAARQAIYRYQVDPVEFLGWALDHVEWRGDERVVDVGCGRGQYLARLAGDGMAGHVIGMDLSTGMLASVRRRWPDGVAAPALVNGDAERLPVRDGAADVALAMHMLYHVPDVPQAVAELRRVVRPRGTLLVAANAPGGLAELYRLRWDSISAVAGHPVEPWNWFSRFNLDNGVALLRAAFEHVDVHRLERELRVPEPEPVVAFLDSQSLPDGVLPEGLDWSRVVDEMHRRAAARIAKEGVFSVTVRLGVLVCR